MKITKETQAQIIVSSFCVSQEIPFYHFPSEGKRSWAYGKLLKDMGCKAGVADCFMPSAGTHKDLWIELKIKPNKLTIDQQLFLDARNAEGSLALSVREKTTQECAINAIIIICNFYTIIIPKDIIEYFCDKVLKKFSY